MMGDFDRELDEMRRARREQVRPIEVRPIDEHVAPRLSGGVELRIELGQMTTVIDLNVHELRAWAATMIAAAAVIEGRS